MSANGHRAVCKGNFVATVKGILPLGFGAAAATTFRARRQASCDKELQRLGRGRQPSSGIILFTAAIPRHGGCHGHHPRHQAHGPAQARQPPSASSPRSGCAVQDLRVLRSARSPSGQVRDVAASARRGDVDQGSGGCVRLVAAGILPGTSAVPTSRPAGPTAAPAGPAALSQTQRRHCGLHSPTARLPANPVTFDVGGAASDHLRPQHSSAQRRACAVAAWEKNGAAPISGEDDWLSRCGEPWSERYEDVRCQALKGGERADGHGLVLVLRRGLVSWMEAWPRPAPSSERGSRAPGELPTIDFSSPLCQELAHILAGVILQYRQEVRV